MLILKFLLFSIINYLMGSIPWGLIIGKVFYNTDIREGGSHNLGATNAGRLLGKKAAFAVGFLDASKGFIAFMIEAIFDYKMALLSCVFVAIGHCWPLFANFKGGKAVSTTAGIILAISLASIKAFILIALIPLMVWLGIKKFTGLVSLASIYAVLVSTFLSCFAFTDVTFTIILALIFMLVAYRHKDNIKRLLEGKEVPANY